MTSRVGTNLDRYEIDAELGRGAMGVVYRARDPKLGRTVAIKTISLAGLEPDAEQEYRQRFVVEAQAAGRLSHPGIVTIFDVREETEPYLVMEYVEGQSLQQLVNREKRTLPLSTTLRLIQEVAEALHYAHVQGVVHRDIKPANILVTQEGHPKIADFGIAKVNQSSLTLPGQVLGSPAFMAPEQLSDEEVDSRSDLFSLGVVLYYMLTGHRPFQGNSTTTVCFKLVNHEPVPVSVLESKVPPELDKIVSRAIAKDPAQRYQTGMAMASDIRELRERGGFVHREELVERTAKRNDIPREKLAGPDPQEQKAAALQVNRRHDRKVGANTETFEKKIFSSAALALGVLAAAALSFMFWTTHTDGSAKIDPVVTGHAIDKNILSVDSGGEQPPAAVKAVELEPKPAASRTLAPALRTKPPSRGDSDAMLQLEIEHHFANTIASVWIDNRLVYTQLLHGERRRRALLFRKAVGHQFQVIPVTAGAHDVRVRIQSAADGYDQSRIISAAFTRGTSLLQIVCDDKGEGLQLSFQKADPAPSPRSSGLEPPNSPTPASARIR